MNNRETIHILFTPDDRFAMPYGVLMTSLLENNRECHFCFWILTDVLSENNINNYKETAALYDAEVRFVFVQTDYYPYLPLKENDRFAAPGYYRLFAADLLPGSVSKVLYLDGDMIVMGNIEELWQIDLEGYSLAGVIDVHDKIHSKRLQMQGRYINSGMLLINLDYHREHSLVEKYKERLKYIHFHRDEFVFHDQDVFNYACDGAIRYLPLHYNLMTTFLLEGVNLQDFINDRDEKIVFNQCIIHYTGYPKPWVFHYYDLPLANEWKYYYKKSKWYGEQNMQVIPIWKRLLFYVLRFFVKIKVLKLKCKYKNIKDIDTKYIPSHCRLI